MKKTILSLTVVAVFFSCNSVKDVNTSTLSQAATLLSSLSSNLSVQQITTLFSLLDTNNDEVISLTEAIGSVSENFNVLDTDSNSSLNLTELTGLLSLLK
ncbi:EF-hand domain-containing protein [Winogradskyella thalassocola]|uniref:EF-hand domain pair n=1 Tax=Winogradskyella thalassocola TaxID=262004 RepID=A0A1G8DFQ8_9FLAO|nr:EF-hand domain-containing protein [Winogradskyella thalassocola]SDH56493.1 EF-hand domain pair [Winogradskyella thalassocola]